MVEVWVLGLFYRKPTLLTPFFMLWYDPIFSVDREVRRSSPLEWTPQTRDLDPSWLHDDLVEFRVRLLFGGSPWFLFFVVTLVTLSTKMWAFLHAAVDHQVCPTFLKDTVKTRVSKPAFLVEWAVWFFWVSVLDYFLSNVWPLEDSWKVW